MRSPSARAARPGCRQKRYAPPSSGLCDVALSCCHTRRGERWRRERSRVGSAFHRLEQLLHIVVGQPGWQPEFSWCHNERLWARPVRSLQSEAEEMVNSCLEGAAGATHLLGQETSNIVVQRKCGAHIMMLTR